MSMSLEIRDKIILSDIAINCVILYNIEAENVMLFQDLLWARVSWWISPGLEVHWLLHAHLDCQGIWLHFCWPWVNVACFHHSLSFQAEPNPGVGHEEKNNWEITDYRFVYDISRSKTDKEKIFNSKSIKSTPYLFHICWYGCFFRVILMANSKDNVTGGLDYDT